MTSSRPPRRRSWGTTSPARHRRHRLHVESLECRTMLAGDAPIHLRAMPGTLPHEVFMSWELPPTVNPATVADFVVQTSQDDGLTWTTVNDGVSNSTHAVLRIKDSPVNGTSSTVFRPMSDS